MGGRSTDFKDGVLFRKKIVDPWHSDFRKLFLKVWTLNQPHQNHREYSLKDSWAHPRYLSQTLQGNKTGICIPDMFADGLSEHQDFRTTVKLEGYQVEESI